MSHDLGRVLHTRRYAGVPPRTAGCSFLYIKAYKRKMTIGTLAWLWYVRASGTLTRPADQLLHYPIPDKPAEGFVKEVALPPACYHDPKDANRGRPGYHCHKLHWQGSRVPEETHHADGWRVHCVHVGRAQHGRGSGIVSSCSLQGLKFTHAGK